MSGKYTDAPPAATAAASAWQDDFDEPEEGIFILCFVAYLMDVDALLVR